MTEQITFDFMNDLIPEKCEYYSTQVIDGKGCTTYEHDDETEIVIEESSEEEVDEIVEDISEEVGESPENMAETFKRVYYPINENLARIAHEMNSMHDYKPNSQTDEYMGYCNSVYDLAEKCAKERPKCAEKAWYKAQKYSYKMAKWFNDTIRNEASCPSVLVSGPANFPTKKKARQNSRRDTLHKEYNEIQGIIRQIKGMLYGSEVIRSDEEDAVEQLKDKIERLEAEQEKMKKVNAYYRKHKTVKGCEGISDIQAEKIMAAISGDWRGERAMPYNSYLLTNNNQNIHRLKDRLKTLEETKSIGSSEEENDLFKVVRNSEAMRLQLLFDGKPEAETISLLKHYGFKWSPKNSAWQRNLNANGEWALRMIKEKLGV